MSKKSHELAGKLDALGIVLLAFPDPVDHSYTVNVIDEPQIEKLMDQFALMQEHELAVRMLHQKEMFGDCVEDGDPWPCKTIRVLDWRPDSGQKESE
jgi:hypothetical protein